ncbi:MAG: hypothetical protein WBA28_02470 [Microbacteriaceae bacterium]
MQRPRDLAHRLLQLQLTLETRFGERLNADRGDVPGWILITLMTSGLVVLIWALAGPALADIFDQAIRRVTGSIR